MTHPSVNNISDSGFQIIEETILVVKSIKHSKLRCVESKLPEHRYEISRFANDRTQKVYKRYQNVEMRESCNQSCSQTILRANLQNCIKNFWHFVTDFVNCINRLKNRMQKLCSSCLLVLNKLRHNKLFRLPRETMTIK